MKKILITGSGSYIGTSFQKYITRNYQDAYEIDTVDMIDGIWREKDFSEYDVVFHVAGIAHQKETKENTSLYYSVNRDLAIETATKAKREGVGQFIFLSSMSVYGMDTGVITKATVPSPKSNYGKSKLQAEQAIIPLEDENFKVAILRPPMIFGPGCKGNFQQIVKLIDKFPVFPKTDNRRSLLYIDNLCSFVKLTIDNELSGFYFPDNQEYIDTYSIAREIAIAKKKNVHFSRILGICAVVLGVVVPKARKAFGSLVYKDVEDFDYSYCVADKATSLKNSAEQN